MPSTHDDTTVYRYAKKDGTPVLRVRRAPDKQFSQFRPDGKGGWKSDAGGVRWIPPYRLPALYAFPDAALVFVEGEKACEAAQAHIDALGIGDQYQATCWAGGANRGAIRKLDAPVVAGRHVVLWPDNDAVGEAAMTMLAWELTKREQPSSFSRVNVTSLEEKGDAADIDRDTFLRMLKSAASFTPVNPAKANGKAGSGGATSRVARLRPTQDEWMQAHPALKRVGKELKGPCPLCGGEDRFYVRDSGAFFCRRCCPDGSNAEATRALMKAAGLEPGTGLGGGGVPRRETPDRGNIAPDGEPPPDDYGRGEDLDRAREKAMAAIDTYRVDGDADALTAAVADVVRVGGEVAAISDLATALGKREWGKAIAAYKGLGELPAPPPPMPEATALSEVGPFERPPPVLAIVGRDGAIGTALAEGRVCLLAGEGGTGKSTLASDLALSVTCAAFEPAFPVAAIAAFGHERALGAVLWASYEESAEEIRWRLLARTERGGSGDAFAADALNRIHVADLSGAGALFGPADRHGAAGLYNQRPEPLAAMAALRRAALAIRPRLLVIDPAMAAYTGDSIQPSAVRAFVQSLETLARETGRCGVLLLVHATKKPEGPFDRTQIAGSAQWTDAARGALSLSYEDEPHTRTLAVVKANQGPSRMWHPIKAIRERDDGGAYVGFESADPGAGWRPKSEYGAPGKNSRKNGTNAQDALR